VRIWDVHPGYLDRLGLLAEHREAHALLSVIRAGKRGYSRHPETLRWVSHVPALGARHDQLAAELDLRGYRHRSPAPWVGDDWPPVFLDPPGEQLRLLAVKLAARRSAGRIPLPRNSQELWAHHKYSVLARDPRLYRELGVRLAGEGARGLAELAEELTLLLRTRPSPGGIQNALEHLWGYVKRSAGVECRSGVGRALSERPADVLREIAKLASEQAVEYVLRSTALSDLAFWLGRKDGPEG
jgi:hypothetical protein